MSTSLAQLPLYGRKFKIEVSIPGENGTKVLTVASSDLASKSLRATFDIYTVWGQWYWTADIVIWNLDQTTTDAILNPPPFISQGMTVTVEAGYQNGHYGLIWSGPVFQPLWERENVVDFKIILHCIIGLDEITRNNISGTYSALTNQTDLIRQMAAQAFKKINVVSISDNIKPTQLPRGKSVFGSPSKYFSQIAKDNNMQWWLSQKGLSLGFPDEDVPVSDDDVAVYTPETGLIGTPQQTQWGVQFRTLLDPKIEVKRPAMQVKIDQSAIRLAKKQIGEQPGILDENGVYIIGAVRYLGDTRGNDWYNEIVGYTSAGGKMAMMTNLAKANVN